MYIVSPVFLLIFIRMYFKLNNLTQRYNLKYLLSTMRDNLSEYRGTIL